MNVETVPNNHKHVNINLRDKVCLINAPMSNKKMNELYTVNFLGNVVGGEIIKYANQTGTILVFSKTRHFKH